MLVHIPLCLCCVFPPQLLPQPSTTAWEEPQKPMAPLRPLSNLASQSQQRGCATCWPRAKFSCASWISYLRFYGWQRLRRGRVGCDQRALELLWASTLLPGSCGHREPSPRPEAIPPPSIPMVQLPSVGLRDEKVVLSNQNCSSPACGNTQRGKAVGHRCDTRDRDPAGT